jgi:hypothetical protein
VPTLSKREPSSMLSRGSEVEHLGGCAHASRVDGLLSF